MVLSLRARRGRAFTPGVDIGRLAFRCICCLFSPLLDGF
jgi:hypothetical protein